MGSSRTLRPWWRLVLLTGTTVGVAAAIVAMGWAVLPALLVLVPLACFARPRVQLTEEGIAYRGLWPSEDIQVRWNELTQVAVDRIDPSTPGNPQHRVARLHLLTDPQPPRSAILWSVRAATPVIEAARRRGVDVLDQR